MMTKNAEKNRTQIQYFCMDDLVPEGHLLRLIEEAINWDFIYDLVVEKYSPDWGRPSMDTFPPQQPRVVSGMYKHKTS